jgi:hypothetical protein
MLDTLIKEDRQAKEAPCMNSDKQLHIPFGNSPDYLKDLLLQGFFEYVANRPDLQTDTQRKAYADLKVKEAYDRLLKGNRIDG